MGKMRAVWSTLRGREPAMRLTIVLSLFAHLLLLGLFDGRPPTRPPSLVTMTIVDRAPTDQPAVTPSPEPSGPRSTEHRPTPRIRRVARMAPIAPPAAPLPTPDPTPEPDEKALPPEPEMMLPDEVEDGLALGVPDGTGVGGGGSGGPDLHRDPGLDPDSCTNGLQYPVDVRSLRDEVVVRLRVVLDAKGHVHDAAVIEHAGLDYDATALRAVRDNCRFTPALDKIRQGGPVRDPQLSFSLPPQ